MSKYNNIKSIPIESLSPEELAQAIKEWAEDDETMEKLLWTCYKNGVKTSGCHAGKRPYLGIQYEEKSKEKIIQLIGTVLSVKGSQAVFFPDGGNPFSGPNWYKPNIALGFDVEYKEEADQLFDMMSNGLQTNEENNTNYSNIIKLFNFLIGKYSGITLRMIHNQNDEYTFKIERSIHDDEIEIFKELNNLLSSSGLTLIEDETPFKRWIIKSNDEKELVSNLITILNNIISNYSLKKPESMEESSRLNIKAHIKRDECIKQGKMNEFDLWLMEEERKRDEELAKTYAEKQKNKI